MALGGLRLNGLNGDAGEPGEDTQLLARFWKYINTSFGWTYLKDSIQTMDGTDKTHNMQIDLHVAKHSSTLVPKDFGTQGIVAHSDFVHVTESHQQ